MKIEVPVNVIVDVETDVSVELVCDALAEKCGDASGEYWRPALEALAFMTRLMLELDQQVVEAFPAGAREILCARLHDAANRFEV